jgi:MoaA/NifB/PqqE/SkfB family radical SAM enzyme
MALTNHLRRATRVVASRLRGTPVLVKASLYPTSRCNLRCTYCSSPYRRTNELTTAQWRTVLDELAALGCGRVIFLGGEPLLRTDLPDLLAHAHHLGMSCALTSNGLLVPRLIERLRVLDTLVLSLDAPGPANDAVRGRGVFAAVQAAIAAAKQHSVPVKLNAVMSAVTAPFLDDLLEFTAANDLHLTINVMRSGEPDLWHEAATIKDEDAAIERLLHRLTELARRNRRVLFAPATYRYSAAWGEYGRDRIEAGDVPPDDPRVRNAPQCHAGRYYMAIDSDGTTYPCNITFDRLRGGNVVTDGVAAAWRALHDHPCVACFAPCLVETNSLFALRPQVLANFAQRHVARFA